MKDYVTDIPTYEDMLAAHERIAPHIRRTPVCTSDYLNEVAGCELFFKCENFQEPGALRSAVRQMLCLDLTMNRQKKVLPPIHQATMRLACPMRQ